MATRLFCCTDVASSSRQGDSDAFCLAVHVHRFANRFMRLPPSVWTAATLLAAFFSASSAEAVSYNVNLLSNPGAEAGAASDTGAPVAIPGWPEVNGPVTVVSYGAPGLFPTADQGPIG